MSEREFPKTVEDIKATLIDIYRHSGQSNFVELLESADSRIEFTENDHWNGGTSYYSLMLDVKVPVFVTVSDKLQDFETDIKAKLDSICRNLSHDFINNVSITPLTSKSSSAGPKAKPTDAEVKHIWKEGFFRLFLSHVSVHKAAIAKLKSELDLRGISAFVAHEDIMPSLEWQDEIVLALRSMHALAALLTTDFHSSNWTDQEIGFALGKGVLVVPVRLGSEPYGFLGKVQALSGSLEQFDQVANRLSIALLNHSSTHRHMRKGLVLAFEAADSHLTAIELSKMIAMVEDFADAERTLMQRVCRENHQVFNAAGVVSRVCSAIGVPEPSKVIERDALPF